jgi:uncharacterized protein YejL (UPF0352 family)
MELEEAKKLLMEELKQRQEVCETELMAVLDKHNCVFQVDLKLNGNQIIPNLTIIAK